MKNYSLSKKERIKERKIFALVINQGKTIFSENRIIKTQYLVIKDTAKPAVKIGIAVSKKNGNAVWRNRVKRLIRESFRLNKTEIVNICKSNFNSVFIVFTAINLNQNKNKKIKLDFILPQVTNILKKISSVL